MQKRLKLGLLSLVGLVAMAACTPEGNIGRTSSYTYTPYAIMIDTTSVVGTNAKYRIDTTLYNYFEDNNTAFIKSYSGDGATMTEVMTQIYEQIRVDYLKEIGSVRTYDYQAILKECAPFFTGRVDVGYGVIEFESSMLITADTVAKGVVITAAP